MRGATLLGILTLGAALVFGYVANLKVPDESSHPWQVKWEIAFRQTIKLLTKYMDCSSLPNVLSAKCVDPVRQEYNLKVTEAKFDGVKVRVYQPPQSSGLQAGIVYYHGGGWVAGSPDSVQVITQEIAHHTGSVVISVDYRMAPVYPFPVPFEDCLKSTIHFLRNLKQYRVDPERIAVAGDSAGGNLAAAVALKLRDDPNLQKLPKVKVQLLIYPALQSIQLDSPSYQENSNDPFLSKESMVAYWLLYMQGSLKHLEEAMANNHTIKAIKEQTFRNQLSNEILWKEMDVPKNQGYKHMGVDYGNKEVWSEWESVMKNPYFAPLMHHDFANLPKTWIYTCQQDVLRDDGLWYAHALRKAGNDVTLLHDLKALHAFFNFQREVFDAKHSFQEMLAYIKKTL